MKHLDCSAPSSGNKLAVRIWLENVPTPPPASIDPSRTALQGPTFHNSKDPCKMVRAPERSLTNLTSSGTVVLFTPVIVPLGASKAANRSTQGTDPFETLGRALSRHHKRIHHVPYVPKVGFTDTHDAFLGRADAVIVVMCEPESTKHAGLSAQNDFAQRALEASKARTRGRAVKQPLVLIQCGDQERSWWPSPLPFETVLKCRTYDTDSAQSIAEKLFK